MRGPMSTTLAPVRSLRPSTGASLFICALLAPVACSGGSGGGAPSGSPNASPDAAGADRPPPDSAPAASELPASGERMEIVRFLTAGTYRNAPWVPETPGPRERHGETSPHDRVRVFLSPALVASQRAGRDGVKDPATGDLHPPHDRGSMAVKELYDDAGAVVGLAAMYKTEEGPASNAWVYYCHGPDGRCRTNGPSSMESPVYGRGTATACGFCHNGTVYTRAP